MITKTCLYCGKTFNAKKVKQKFCSIGCNSKYYGERSKKYKMCPVCNKSFWCGSSRRVYCSGECKLKVKQPKAIKTIYYCKTCGKEIIGHSKLHCSEKCKMKYEQQRHKEYYMNEHQPRTFVCKVCGRIVTTTYGDKRRNICSDACKKQVDLNSKHQSKYHKLKRKINGRERKKLICKVTIDNFTYNDLFIRDKGICQICGMPISTNKEIDNNWNGTIDHIIPLSRGGKNSKQNCQITHRICNSMKLQAGKEYKVNWIELAKGNTRWKKKFEQYINDMLVSGEIRLVDSHLFYYKRKA